MSRKGRTLDEWFEIVTECRQSGLSDAVWCEQNGVSAKSFYNAVTRLRRKACEVPKRTKRSDTIDFTTTKQEVVKITVEPEEPLVPLIPHSEPNMYLDNSHTIEIEIYNCKIRLSNSSNPLLIDQILSSIRRVSC